MRRGLIVGRFLPPHRGHGYLIEQARSLCDALTVVIAAKEHDTPSGELRASWLRELHPGVTVLVLDDPHDEQDPRVWAPNLRAFLGYAPEVVFSSEDYGDVFALHLGAQHVCIDRPRAAVPISATAVRAHPLRCWEFLEPPVRAYYAKRVYLIGAESTGKTTLAMKLAEHFATVWVPEYGREYAASVLAHLHDYAWAAEDFARVARRQCELEDAAARQANRVLICDTDALATSIWHRRYLHERSMDVEALIASRRAPNLYLLTDVATPFVQDGTRDGEAIREWMHATIVEELTARGLPFVTLRGSFAEREAQAVGAVEGLLR
ncbi:MAG TPA: AAA family ATPase [Thermoanaerobaculia bacterium]